MKYSYTLTLWLLLLVGACWWLVVIVPDITDSSDFQRFWLSSKCFLLHENPYSQNLTEKSGQLANAFYNPPLYFSFFWWIALFNFEQATCIFRLLSILLLVFSLLLLSPKQMTTVYKFPNFLWVVVGLCSFVPVIMLLRKGQLSAFILFSLTLFLWRASKQTNLNANFWAGFFLVGALVKAHIIYLVLLYLFLTSLCNKSTTTIWGLIFGLFLLLTPITIYYPNIWHEYLALDHSITATYWQPTLGSWLQAILGAELSFLRWLPLIFCCALLIVLAPGLMKFTQVDLVVYYLLPISLFTAPYAGLYDFVLALPAFYLLLIGALNTRHSEKWKSAKLILTILMVINILCCFGPPNMALYIWLPIALLFLVEYSRRNQLLMTLHSEKFC